jgi:hypothetical protein
MKGGLPARFRSEHNSWHAMIQRCYYKGHKNYGLYGGRGIVVCERWRTSFPNFLADMGAKPTSKHSLDRFPNQSGNYEPANCRWATMAEQANNKRNNNKIKFNNESKNITQWARLFNTDQATIKRRLSKGLPLDKPRDQFGVPPRMVGSDNCKAKLSEADVIKIREMAKEMSHSQIARAYSLKSPTTISNIINKKSWNHI